MQKPILFFDADDTLWECNRYFRAIMHQFCDRLSEKTNLEHDYIYKMILKFEHERLKIYGYGSFGFIQCLKDVYQELSNEASINDHISHMNTWIDKISEPLVEFQIQLIEGVSETLAILKQRNYEMHMLTKGDRLEQNQKISNSKIDHFFEKHHIFEHKHEHEYLSYLDENNFKPNQTVMIGNSPKSDILPCLKIGMKAIFIPHDSSWELEHAELPNHPNKTELKSISQLLTIFL